MTWQISNIAWLCVINSDGSIVRGYLIDSCDLKGANEYVITWKAKTNFSCVIGSAAFEPVEPGFCAVGLLEDPLKMRMCTYDVGGEPAKRSFHLACFRDPPKLAGEIREPRPT